VPVGKEAIQEFLPQGTTGAGPFAGRLDPLEAQRLGLARLRE